MVVRFGAFLAFIGFGSSLLHFTDVQFRLVMWAEPFQPLLGLGLGAVGVVICLIAYAFQQRKETSAYPPAYQPPPQQFAPPPPYAPPPQQFAPAPQQFAGPPQQFAGPPQPYYPQYPPTPQGPPPGYPYGQR
jgi:hypothetical protein